MDLVMRGHAPVMRPTHPHPESGGAPCGLPCSTPLGAHGGCRALGQDAGIRVCGRSTPSVRGPARLQGCISSHSRPVSRAAWDEVSYGMPHEACLHIGH